MSRAGKENAPLAVSATSTVSSFFGPIGGSTKRAGPATSSTIPPPAEKKAKHAQSVPSTISSSSSSSSFFSVGAPLSSFSLGKVNLPPAPVAAPLAKASKDHSSKTPRAENKARDTDAMMEEVKQDKKARKAEKKQQQQQQQQQQQHTQTALPKPQAQPQPPKQQESPQSQQSEAKQFLARMEDVAEPVASPAPVKQAAVEKPAKRASVTPAPAPIPSVVTPAAISTAPAVTVTPIVSTTTFAPAPTPAPLLPTSLHTPSYAHSHRPVRGGPLSMPATATASALLSDFQSSAAMSRLLEEKDAAYELLLSQHRKLKEQKQLDLSALVDGAAAAAELHVRSGAAMVAHWKAEVATSAAATAAEAKAHEATRAKLAAQEEETQHYITKSEELAKKLEEITKKLAVSESLVSSLRDENLSQQESIALAASQHDKLRMQSADSLTTLQAKHAAREQELLQRSSATESDLLRQQSAMDKLLDTFMFVTAMQVRIRSNGWAACKMVNPRAGRTLEFELDIEAPDENKVEYRPTHINLNGIAFPSWLMEGRTFHANDAPSIMRDLMAHVHKDAHADEDDDAE